MSALSLRNELDLLKKEKTDAQRKNHLEAAKYRNSQRDAVNTDTDDTNTRDESRGYETENLPHDPMDWTAQQWAKLDKPQLQSQQKAAFSGYKDMTSLASATYAKETAKLTVDLGKYESTKQEVYDDKSGISRKQPAPEDVDAVVTSLQEASERKQKRRTGTMADKQYVNEKNRQFNMKLDREYGA